MNTNTHAHALNFSWLIRLRWSAFAGQLATILFTQYMLHAELPMTFLGAVLAFEVLSNVAAEVYVRRTGVTLKEWPVVLAMVVDLIALTLLLWSTGGPFNPFSFLYLVHLALGSVVLRPIWTWALALLSSILFGAMFFHHWPLQFAPEASIDAMWMHVEGMWVAFVVAAVFIIYFVTRVTGALRRREADLAAAQAHAARSAQLASLATLAAGAAHELGTPLATIAIASGELEHALSERGGEDVLMEDVLLIRAEVERCRLVLDQLAVDAGHGAGGALEELALSELVGSVVVGLGDNIEVELEEPGRSVSVFARMVIQAVRSVVSNAIDASSGAVVRLRADVVGDRVHYVVEDRGVGMSAEVLRRATEPFFTTKEPGQGMGLGLFLSHTIIRHLGGEMTLRSAPGQGTTVEMIIPLAEARHG